MTDAKLRSPTKSTLTSIIRALTIATSIFLADGTNTRYIAAQTQTAASENEKPGKQDSNNNEILDSLERKIANDYIKTKECCPDLHDHSTTNRITTFNLTEELKHLFKENTGSYFLVRDRENKIIVLQYDAAGNKTEEFSLTDANPESRANTISSIARQKIAEFDYRGAWILLAEASKSETNKEALNKIKQLRDELKIKIKGILISYGSSDNEELVRLGKHGLDLLHKETHVHHDYAPLNPELLQLYAATVIDSSQKLKQEQLDAIETFLHNNGILFVRGDFVYLREIGFAAKTELEPDLYYALFIKDGKFNARKATPSTVNELLSLPDTEQLSGDSRIFFPKKITREINGIQVNVYTLATGKDGLEDFLKATEEVYLQVQKTIGVEPWEGADLLYVPNSHLQLTFDVVSNPLKQEARNRNVYKLGKTDQESRKELAETLMKRAWHEFFTSQYSTQLAPTWIADLLPEVLADRIYCQEIQAKNHGLDFNAYFFGAENRTQYLEQVAHFVQQLEKLDSNGNFWPKFFLAYRNNQSLKQAGLEANERFMDGNPSALTTHFADAIAHLVDPEKQEARKKEIGRLLSTQYNTQTPYAK